jgi:putative copper export protein/mono/diheme cytochrome c family protein
VDVLVKTMLYLGAVLLLGAGVFARWIGPLGGDAERRRLGVGWTAGIVLLLVGSLADVAGALTRALGAFDPTHFPAYLLDTQHGNAVLARVGLVLIVAALGTAGVDRPAVDRPAFALAGGLLLATFSLASHAVGTGRVALIAADLLHLVAMVAWAGSVAYLAWLPIWSSRAHTEPRLPGALRAVSSLGLAAVGVLVATGAFASAQHLWGGPALVQTPYGRALVAKVALVGVVLAVAGANRWVLLPAIGSRGVPAIFGRLVRIEALLLVGVIVASGVLTTRPLPEMPATLAQVVSFREAAGPWVVRGSLSPRGAAGFDLEMSVLDARGAPPADDVSVRLTMMMLDHEMTPARVVAARIGRGAYRAAVPLVMAGTWQIAIEVPGGVVRVPVQARPALETPRGGWERGLPGFLGVLAGGAIGAYALRRLGARVAAAAPLLAASAALVVLSAILGLRALGAESAESGLLDRTNPIPPTAASLSAGERVYRQHCQACHGVTGAGDGPAAAMLRPRPSDLRVHMAAGHTDGQLYFWITEGFAGTAMPAYRTTLSEEERWHVLNFIRTLALTDR